MLDFKKVKSALSEAFKTTADIGGAVMYYPFSHGQKMRMMEYDMEREMAMKKRKNIESLKSQSKNQYY